MPLVSHIPSFYWVVINLLLISALILSIVGDFPVWLTFVVYVVGILITYIILEVKISPGGVKSNLSLPASIIWPIWIFPGTILYFKEKYEQKNAPHPRSDIAILSSEGKFI